MKQREERPVEILPNEPLDMSMFHPDIRASLGDGMPLMTMRAPNGAKVVIMGTALPKTKEENARRWAEARAVANSIAYRAGKRAYEQQLLAKQKEVDSP